MKVPVDSTRPTLLCLSLAICAACFGQNRVPGTRLEVPQQSFQPTLSQHPQFIEGFPQFGETTRKLGSNAGVPAPNLVVTVNSPCSHIIVIRVPQGVDPNMILRVPERSIGTMPVREGFPACPEDLR